MGQPLTYDAQGTPCHGYLALPPGDGPFPGVLVAPAFWGLRDVERGYADRLAAMGRAALAVDFYGNGAVTDNPAEAAAMMGDLAADRPRLAARMQAALDTLKRVPDVDPARCGALGYCFGGKAVLDLARSGADFAAGVVFHGVYDPPPQGARPMRAAILVCDGWDDPLCPPEAKSALAQELTAHCDDWQFLSFGHTVHAFTARGGSGYHPLSDARSWAAMAAFLAERLG